MFRNGHLQLHYEVSIEVYLYMPPILRQDSNRDYKRAITNKASEDFVPHCQTYHVGTKLSPEENAREIRKLYGDDEYSQPASVMECTGVESSVCTAAFTVRRGGTLSTSKIIALSQGNPSPGGRFSLFKTAARDMFSSLRKHTILADLPPSGYRRRTTCHEQYSIYASVVGRGRNLIL